MSNSNLCSYRHSRCNPWSNFLCSRLGMSLHKNLSIQSNTTCHKKQHNHQNSPNHKSWELLLLLLP